MAHFTRIKMKNFCILEDVEISLSKGGEFVIVAGENGSGKTALLDGLLGLQKGKTALPRVKEPVKKGAESALLECDIETESMGLLHIKRVIKADGTWTLTVSTKDSAFKSPQDVLNRLFGEPLDPLEFANADDKAQVETVKRITGLDLSEYEKARDEAYSERTVVNRALKQKEAELKAAAHYPDAPAEEMPLTAPAKEIEEVKPVLVSLVALNKKLDEARAVNAEYGKIIDEHMSIKAKVLDGREDIKDLEFKLAEMKKDLAANEVRYKEVDAKMRAFVQADEAAIRSTIESLEADNAKAQAEADAKNKAAREAASAEAAAHTASAQAANEKVRANRERARLAAEVEKIKAESDALTAKIDKAEADKIAALSAVKMPLEGLTFDSKGVYFQGVPFSQASDGEKIKTSFALALAKMGDLKALIVRNGSLLDKKNQALLVDMAKAAGVQVFEEVVDPEGASIVFQGGQIV